MISFFKNAWKGEAKLWKVFWLMGLLLAAISIVFFLLLTPLMFISPYAYMGIFVAWIFVVNGFQLTANWRCAFNCGWKGWGYIVRTFVVLGVIGMIFNIFATVSGVLMMSEMEDAMGDIQKQMEAEGFQMQSGGFESEGFDPGAFDAEAFNTGEGQDWDAMKGQLDAAMGEMENALKEAEAEMQDAAQGEGFPPMDAPAMAPMDQPGAVTVQTESAEPAAAPANTAPAGEKSLAEMCAEKFDASYKAQGFDPMQYPEQRDTYIKGCAAQVGGGAQ